MFYKVGWSLTLSGRYGRKTLWKKGFSNGFSNLTRIGSELQPTLQNMILIIWADEYLETLTLKISWELRKWPHFFTDFPHQKITGKRRFISKREGIFQNLMENRGKSPEKAFYKQTRGNFSKSLKLLWMRSC